MAQQPRVPQIGDDVTALMPRVGDDVTALMAQTAEPPAQEPAAAAGRDWVDALPSMAGTAFSLAGGSKALPTGLALSAVGGALGEGARQIVRSVQGRHQDVPESAMDRVRAMGGAGLSQGTMEGVGRGIGAALKPIGQTIYGLAMRPSAGLRKEYGLVNLIKRGFDDKILPNRMGENRAAGLMAKSRDEATDIASKKPVEVQLSRVVQKAQDDQAKRAARELQSGGVAPPTDKIAEQITRVIGNNPEKVNMAQLLDLRRGADAIAAPVFKAAKMPGGAGRVPVGSEASVAKSISEAESQTLRDVLGKPFADASRKTQQRFGVMQAAKDAAERPSMLTNLLAGGVGLQGVSSDGDVGEALARVAAFKAAFSPTGQGLVGLAAPTVGRYGLRAADAGSQGEISDVIRRLLMGQLEQQPR